MSQAADKRPEPLPLDGVRVVDLTINVAGPFATLVLGDLGATVTKIEPAKGDDARRLAPVVGNGSAYFFGINRNKRSVALNLRDAGDKALLLELLESADVLVTNLRPGSLLDLQLDYESLKSSYPELIYADLSGYGNEGAERDLPGYDMILQARSGLMSINGEPDSPPSRVAVSILDMGSGLWLALGVLGALRLRASTGRGTRVSTSLLEVGASLMTYDAAAFQLTGELPERRGSEHPAFAPYGAYRTRDGYVAIGVGADRLFERLARALEQESWLEDPRFATNQARVRNRHELRRLLETAFADRTTSEIVSMLREAEVPADAVTDIAEVLADPQLAELDVWLEVEVGDDSAEGTLKLRTPGLPLRFSQERPPVRLAPPELDSAGPELRDTARAPTVAKA
jgi:crotonobetainyl-CoA:carnitine CoA-transferase CaiB-like acyl-CoA transferase